jgi:peptide/nickel transport system permease protein
MRRAASIFLVIVFVAALLADFAAPYSFRTQFRDEVDAPAGRAHLLGTDALGRDRFSRLLYGARLSMLFAPAAALVSVAAALVLALLAGMGGGWWERLTLASADLSLSLPWIFVLLAARAMLPLNAGAGAAAVVTFGLLGLLGWAGPARVMAASVKRHLDSDFVLLARGGGCGTLRLALVHIAPNLLPLAAAQFLIATPTFLLAEANLGLLGLGIPEPLPSWGGLLRELESLPAVAANPWSLAPAVLLVAVVGSFHLLISADEYHI